MMSIRTIVEFNHDMAHQISGNPEEFVSLLGQALNSGSNECWERLSRFGIRAVNGRHHSVRATVEVGDYGQRVEL